MALDPFIMPDASGTAPTFNDVKDAYLLYADWEIYQDSDQATAIERCRLFVTAAKQLLLLLPSASTTRERTSAEFDVGQIQKQIEHARRYLTISGTAFAAGDVQHINLENFRD